MFVIGELHGNLSEVISIQIPESQKDSVGDKERGNTGVIWRRIGKQREKVRREKMKC